MNKNRMATVVALMCVIQTSMLAESKPLELRWNELAPMINGHEIEVVLTDGATMRGEAVAVRENALLMDVKEVRRADGQNKGSVSIARNTLSSIKLQRTRGGWGRTMGTVLGVVGGVSVGGYVAAAHTESAPAAISTFVGMTSGMTLTGYYIGRQLDKRFTVIRIISEKN